MIAKKFRSIGAAVITAGLLAAGCSSTGPSTAGGDQAVNDGSSEASDLNTDEETGDNGQTSTNDLQVTLGDTEGDPGTASTSPRETVEDEVEPVLSAAEQLEASEYLEVSASDGERQVVDSDSCSSLSTVVLDQHKILLEQLGEAARTDDAAINFAFEQSAVNGRLVALKAEALSCEDEELSRLICEGSGELTASGDVGRDLLAQIKQACQTT